MPHITVHSVVGHSEYSKQELAKKIQRIVSEEFNVNADLVSVSIEEVKKDAWRSFIQTVPSDTFYIAPKYLLK